MFNIGTSRCRSDYIYKQEKKIKFPKVYRECDGPLKFVGSVNYYYIM